MIDVGENEFSVPVRCRNCMDYKFLVFKKGTLVHGGTLNFIKCPKCGVQGQLHKAIWNGASYVEVKFND